MTSPLRTNVQTMDDVRRALQLLSPFVPVVETSVPGASDDESKGWKVGSRITVDGSGVSVELKGTYQCFKNTIDGAEWHKLVDVKLDLVGQSDPSGGPTPDPVVDNQITRFDQTAGRIQGSTVFIDDLGNIKGANNHDDIVFMAQSSAFVF